MSSSRRSFLSRSFVSAMSVPVVSWLGRLAAHAAANEIQPKSCIVLFMDGGPSHIDTFDPKPDAPNGHGGPHRPTRTSVAGIQVTELLPSVAGVMEELAIIRSMSTPASTHSSAAYHLRTGRPQRPGVPYPALGAVVSRELDRGSVLPNYICLDGSPQKGVTAGFLGTRYEPLLAEPGRIPYVEAAVDVGRFNRRVDLWNQVEEDFARSKSIPAAEAHRKTLHRAAAMMRSEHLDAFDVTQEPEKVREAYGNNFFGERCLVARRLIERGVTFVEVLSGMWDHHYGIEGTGRHHLPALCSQLDVAFSTLIRDLRDRGLLEDTLVIWMGEFGRTPELKDRPGGGRDHYSKAWSTVMAGGGVPGGQVVGRTDAGGGTVEDRPVSVVDFHATICLLLGVDPYQDLTGPGNQPIPLVDNQEQKPQPIREFGVP